MKTRTKDQLRTEIKYLEIINNTCKQVIDEKNEILEDYYNIDMKLFVLVIALMLMELITLFFLIIT